LAQARGEHAEGGLVSRCLVAETSASMWCARRSHAAFLSLCVLLFGAVAPAQELSQRHLEDNYYERNSCDEEASVADKAARDVAVSLLQTKQREPLQHNVRVQSIAIFAQVFNTDLWTELQQCVQNVIAARENRTVSLYIALTKANQTIQEDAAHMQSMGGLAESKVNIVRNVGADIGEFLQQVQLHSASASKSNVFLKLHTKSGERWRELMIQSLCGSPRQVARVLARFENEEVGVVGPPGLTWTSDGLPADPTENTHNRHLGFSLGSLEGLFGVPGAPLQQLPEYDETWNFIYGEDSDPPDVWTICAGSWFWSRSRPILSDTHLLAAVAQFLQVWETGYSTDGYSECKTFACRSIYALERVLPTIASQNRSVVEAPYHPNRYEFDP